jgi:dTDP-glucose pyrophosphorylase
MLVLGRMPVVGHVLTEVREASIERVRMVLSPAKDLIRDYVGDGQRWGLSVGYSVQQAMRGVGDAILTGLDGPLREPVLAAFGDCAILRRPGANTPCAAARLVEAHARLDADATVLCERVAIERTRYYGVLRPAPVAGPALDPCEPFVVDGIVEKPDAALAPSRWAVAARWVLGPAALERIRRQPPGPNGEIGVTEAVARLLSDGGRVVAVPLLPDERRCDVGNWASLLTAQALAAVWDTEHGLDVTRTLATAEGRGGVGEV